MRPPHQSSSSSSSSFSITLLLVPPFSHRHGVRGILCRRRASADAPNTRSHEGSPHARVCTRTSGQVRVRPSASKPLEVETLRKYNAYGETCLFSLSFCLSCPLYLCYSSPSFFYLDCSFLSSFFCHFFGFTVFEL